MPTVSVVIPAYNEEKYISRLLNSLSETKLLSVKEIIVVDNNSTDKTAEIARGFKGVTVVTEFNKGVAWARAKGAQAASAEIIFFLDADTSISKNWEKRLLESFGDPNVVCVSGPSFYDDLSAWRQILAKIYWKFASVFVYPLLGYMGNFANLAVRKRAYHEIGGIDTNIPFYGDDTNLPRRLSKVGKVIFCYDMFVWASGRRFAKEGMLKTAFRYVKAFFLEVIFRHSSAKNEYTNVR